jgi:hypothetical protein
MSNVINFVPKIDLEIKEAIGQMKAYLEIINEAYKDTKIKVFLYDRSGMIKSLEVPWLDQRREIRIPSFKETSVTISSEPLEKNIDNSRIFKYYKTIDKYPIYREVY